MTSRYSFDRPAVYQIQLQGRRPQAWAYAAAGLVADMKIEVTQAAGGAMPAGEEPITALRGEVADQAALYGLLNQLYDLRLTILSIVRVEGAGAGDLTRPTGSPRSPGRGRSGAG